jgi:signal transduction histidine kinase
MKTKFKNWLINPTDTKDLNIFEKSKINLTIDFAFYYLIFGIFSIIISFITSDQITTIITTFSLCLNLVAVHSIRWSKSHAIAAKVLTFNIVMGVILVSFINHAVVDMMHAIHMLLAILLAYFTVGRKWSILLLGIMSLYLFSLTFLKTTVYFNQVAVLFNPSFTIQNMLFVSPFVTLINAIIIITILDFNHKNQQQMLAIATNSNRLKEGILSVVAHDLTSPIANIIVINDFLKTNITTPQNDDGESIPYIEMIDRMCQQSLSIIHDLVDVAELESANINLEKTPIHLPNFIAHAITSQQAKAAQKDITLSFKNLGESIMVNINTDKFTRVIDNLLTNAIKFTPLGGKINIDISKSNTSALIKIEDNGIGIPLHLQELIFDKFTTAGRRGTSGEKSLGLGMSICKKIVTLHQGKIWFESKDNKGTTFFIELPLVV